MSDPGSGGVTQLLLQWREGDREALDELTPIVYSELRRLARRYMSGEGSGHLLQTTALVHEAYLKLVGLDVEWQGRESAVKDAVEQAVEAGEAEDIEPERRRIGTLPGAP